MKRLQKINATVLLPKIPEILPLSLETIWRRTNQKSQKQYVSGV